MRHGNEVQETDEEQAIAAGPLCHKSIFNFYSDVEVASGDVACVGSFGAEVRPGNEVQTPTCADFRETNLSRNGFWR